MNDKLMYTLYYQFSKLMRNLVINSFGTSIIYSPIFFTSLVITYPLCFKKLSFLQSLSFVRYIELVKSNDITLFSTALCLQVPEYVKMQYRRPVSLLPGPGYHRWMDPTHVRSQTLNLKRAEIDKDVTSKFFHCNFKFLQQIWLCFLF